MISYIILLSILSTSIHGEAPDMGSEMPAALPPPKAFDQLPSKVQPAAKMASVVQTAAQMALEISAPEAKQICETTCQQYCPNCTEPVRCDDTQTKCGVKPIDPKMSQCPTDDICVPSHCECKYIMFETYLLS